MAVGYNPLTLWKVPATGGAALNAVTPVMQNADQWFYDAMLLNSADAGLATFALNGGQLLWLTGRIRSSSYSSPAHLAVPVPR